MPISNVWRTIIYNRSYIPHVLMLKPIQHGIIGIFKLLNSYIMNNLFIAKFAQVSGSEHFEADKNGNLPFIGTLLAGKAKGTLINGTIFGREGLKVGQLYLCQNTTQENIDPDKPALINVEIVSEVSPLDFVAMSKDLGEPVLVRPKATEEEPVAVATTVDESEVVDAD